MLDLCENPCSHGGKYHSLHCACGIRMRLKDSTLNAHPVVGYKSNQQRVDSCGCPLSDQYRGLNIDYWS